MKPNEFLNRPLRLLIIWGSILLFAFYVWSAAEARKNTSNRVIDWLPSETEELDVFLNRYYRYFPEGELLMVSWPGCDVDDERLDEVAATLLAPQQDGGPPLFERVMTTRSVLDELTDVPLELSRAEARSRLAGWLIGRNGRDACLVALISETGSLDRKAAIDSVYSAVKTIIGLSRPEINVAGPTIDSVAIDKISEDSQNRLVPFFLLFCFILLLCCLRSPFAAFIVFAVALMNEELSGTLLYWTGSHVDSISLLISSLVYVLTISAGVHIVNYYRETLQETDPDAAPWQTAKKAALPCTLAVLTTVFGFGSLTVSKMIPIRTFGIYGSIALMLGTAWLFLYLIAILQQYPIRRWSRETSKNGKKSRSFGKRFWGIFGKIVRRYRVSITILSFLLMIFFSFGVERLKTTVTFHGMLPESAEVIRNYDALEKKIGGLIPVEVVLAIPDEGNEKITPLEQLYLLQTMRDTLSAAAGVDSVISALNFVPDLPPRDGRSVALTARRTAVRSMVTRNLDRLKDARFYNRSETTPGGDGAASLWRMSLRVPSRESTDYAVLLGNIREKLESVRSSESASSISGIRFDVTGGIPLVHRAQQQLLEDLISSFISAFALIALTMIVMLRGIVRGLLAMVPNIFPCVLVFGALGWMNIPVDMGSMMTASVAMGIAVDGTLHFLTWFNIGLRRGLLRRHAVFFAYRRCATALTQTTIICGFGMLVYGFSDFVPVSRFAVLMCLLLSASLIGDIVVLPAILFTPLGKVFERKSKVAGKQM